MRIALFATVIALAIVPSVYAHAGEKDFLGKWSGKGLEDTKLSATIKKSGSGAAASIQIYSPGCIGEINVAGEIEGDIFTGFSKINSDNPSSCKIILTRDGKELEMEEDYDTCHIYHGSSCTFDGTLSRRK